ncbi:helical backbone metal receptor [Thorsellia kenyensis]|uniref:Helical backbone metal receptor n=1 Tax=Thorsellia kenyensis TaxID=1549888 RepID=A0ABV6C9N9_9GAMM
MPLFTKITVRVIFCLLHVTPLYALNTQLSSSLNQQSAVKIATLTPNLAELAVSAGLSDNLVGVSAYSDYPSSLSKLPIISDSQGVFVETLLAAKPDVVIAQEQLIPSGTQLKLKKIGLDVREFSLDSIEEMIQVITELSQWTEDKTIGQHTLISIKNDVKEIDELFNTHNKKYRVFIQYSTHPILTSNRKNIFNELLSRCGVVNIFGNEINKWPIVTEEGIVKSAPEIIMAITDDEKFYVEFNESIQNFFVVREQEPRKHYLSLLQHNDYIFNNVNLIILNPDIFSRETPRLVNQTRFLCEVIQKELDELKKE